MSLLYLFHLTQCSLLALAQFLTSEYFAMFSADVFITNMLAKIFCPDKQTD